MRSTLNLAPDPREHVQTMLARCYVAMSEVDYDLARWREVVQNPMRVIDLRSPAWSTSRNGRTVETLQVTL